MAHCTAKNWKYQLPWVFLAWPSEPKDPSRKKSVRSPPSQGSPEDDPATPPASGCTPTGRPPGADPPTTSERRPPPTLNHPYRGLPWAGEKQKAFRLAIHGKETGSIDWPRARTVGGVHTPQGPPQETSGFPQPCSQPHPQESRVAAPFCCSQLLPPPS
ncbi:uncharacterized protein [Macrobrachium rosenbergii]|uniref:uncharacterized protein n=1 Tax=Macrobrachium rosenbergii TaxID=79674 RepID=UPI0034D414A3